MYDAAPVAISTPSSPAQARHLGAGFEVLADALAQEVHAQVDRAHAREALQHLFGGVGGVLVGDGGHQREARGGVQHGADHAAVQPAVEEVAHQLGAHVEAQRRRGRCERLQAQAQHLVEADALLEHVGQCRDEARLFVGAAGSGGGFFVSMRHGTRC